LQVLREAKEKAERESQETEDKEATRKAHFETLFDDYQGISEPEVVSELFSLLWFLGEFCERAFLPIH
jgi:Protein of unknown function (DUF719).